MTNKNVLIITSSQENIGLYEAVLLQEGLNIFKAENSVVGLRITLEKEPALIIIDEYEFVGEGYKILKELKERQIPARVIVCPVALDSFARIIKFIRGGVYDYITLPVEPNRLIESVKNALTLDYTLISDPAPIVEKLLIRIEQLTEGRKTLSK